MLRVAEDEQFRGDRLDLESVSGPAPLEDLVDPLQHLLEDWAGNLRLLKDMSAEEHISRTSRSGDRGEDVLVLSRAQDSEPGNDLLEHQGLVGTIAEEGDPRRSDRQTPLQILKNNREHALLLIESERLADVLKRKVTRVAL